MAVKRIIESKEYLAFKYKIIFQSIDEMPLKMREKKIKEANKILEKWEKLN